jgi:hypothetical protein
MSNPNPIATDLLQDYTGDVPTQEVLVEGKYNFIKEIDADNFHIIVHLSQLFSQESFKKIREKYYRGAIGVIYIHQKNDNSSLKSAQSLYNEFKQLEFFSDYQIIFLGILKREVDYPEINPPLKENKITYLEVMEGDFQTFDKIIRSLVSHSSYFQAMTQGSCDLSVS